MNLNVQNVHVHTCESNVTNMHIYIAITPFTSTKNISSAFLQRGGHNNQQAKDVGKGRTELIFKATCAMLRTAEATKSVWECQET